MTGPSRETLRLLALRAAEFGRYAADGLAAVPEEHGDRVATAVRAVEEAVIRGAVVVGPAIHVRLAAADIVSAVAAAGLCWRCETPLPVALTTAGVGWGPCPTPHRPARSRVHVYVLHAEASR